MSEVVETFLVRISFSELVGTGSNMNGIYFEEQISQI